MEKQMRTIKRHSHQDRINTAENLVTFIEKRFGNNLEGIAVRGSTARNTDGPYSDLEMFAFIKKMPEQKKYKPYGKERKIIDGLCIELIWITADAYIQNVKEITGAWFGAGADFLLALRNKPLIQKLQSHKPKDKKKRCLDQAAALWDHLQEAATKTLNAAERKDKEGMALVIHDMFSNMLKMVSFLTHNHILRFHA